MIVNIKQRKYERDVETSAEDIANLQKIAQGMSMPQERAIVQGTVISVTKDHVWVDIGVKSEGKISIEEFSMNGHGEVPREGDMIELWLDKLEGHKGLSISYSKVKHINSWKALDQIFRTGSLIDGIISNQGKGGFTVNLLPWGVKAFLPISQTDLKIRNLANTDPKLLSKEKFTFVIIKMERKWNIVVSRKNIRGSEEEISEQTEEKTEPASS
ncbi:S1 RNA-binding domain-containing protein [Candidatus Nesciobacter abundans]|uniref:S1 RNA-binding domain-containing protein n=1 Tax=Candidatus Nesciobacter abundans TaxID=2601668 RepID=A0A5C0UGM8_9PROT|nr:S1 RNA-binding domain-containing protein [Candidatus Nesciobacter abundans]QEK39275.1 S1 RNA-binding domain-containing protein [Candidatus Nesciobacter abundans]